MNNGHTRPQLITSSILIALSIVSCMLVGYVGLLTFQNNLLAMNYRMIGLGILLFFSLLFLGIGFSHGSAGRYLCGILFCGVLIFLLFLIIQFISIGLSTLRDIQGSTLPGEEEGMGAQVEIDTDSEAFLIYLSGLDGYGDLEMKGRSDVNMLITVNPETKKVLVVSVPRDSYFAIGGDGNWGMDKLTHAGIYGIRASEETLERAFDVDIDYYVKMNFTSFMQIIDAIGGIELDNPTAFATFDDKYFPQGTISLDSEDALSYVRERKQLEDGDLGRQKNQMRVIEATFRKILSPSLLFNYAGIMDTVSATFETNMPSNSIMNFANAQMGVASQWEFLHRSLRGTDAEGLPSYAMPDSKLYFFVPDERSIGEIHNAIMEQLGRPVADPNRGYDPQYDWE